MVRIPAFWNRYGNGPDNGYQMSWQTYQFRLNFLCRSHRSRFNNYRHCQGHHEGRRCSEMDKEVNFWPCLPCTILTMKFYRHCEICRTRAGPNHRLAIREQPPGPAQAQVAPNADNLFGAPPPYQQMVVQNGGEQQEESDEPIDLPPGASSKSLARRRFQWFWSRSGHQRLLR